MRLIRSLFRSPLFLLTANSSNYKITLIVGCYFFILASYIILFYDHLLYSMRYPDTLIIPIMSVGSFVAGSTFLGGGAVAFPALTKVLQFDPFSAKTFSLAIQSVGMTSAAIYILASVSNIPYKLLVTYIIAAAVGLFFCLFYYQELFTPTDIRISFTLFLICSLVLYLFTSIDLFSNKKSNSAVFGDAQFNFTDYKQLFIVLLFGGVGGFISGLLGSGADLILFCLLSFYYRLSLKVSIQVSVVAMAAVSLIGIYLQYTASAVSEEVFRLWLLAAPVVLVGAPLGVLFCKKISAIKLLVLIALMVFVELITTLLMLDIKLHKLPIYFFIFVFFIVALCLLNFMSPYRYEDGSRDDL